MPVLIGFPQRKRFSAAPVCTPSLFPFLHDFHDLKYNARQLWRWTHTPIGIGASAWRFSKVSFNQILEEDAVYIRWIVRSHKSESAQHMRFHDAYLVESFRNQAGNPRQRTIAYLGNLREINDELPGIERELFLVRARHTLAGIRELNSSERENVMDLLQQVATPLSPVEHKHAFYQNLHWYLHSCYQRGLPLPTGREIYQLMEEIEASLPAL